MNGGAPGYTHGGPKPQGQKSLVAAPRLGDAGISNARLRDMSIDYKHDRVRRPPLTRLRSDGTAYILAGSAVAGVAAYAFQLLGGRVLGAEDFAPLSVLLTVHFIALIVFLIPIEQSVVRRLTLDRRLRCLTSPEMWLGGVTVLGATVFAWWGVDQYLNGDHRFILFTSLTVAGHFMFVTGRGHLAGLRRFRDYGLASGGASLLRLAVAVLITLVHPSASGFAVGLVLGPVVLYLWRPFSARSDNVAEPDDVSTGSVDGNGGLGGLVLGSAASQALLLSGPILVGLLGGSAVEISVAFAAFTLARAPLVFGYNLIARVLPTFTGMAARGEKDELEAWARGLAWAATALGGLAAVLGWLLGPAAVRFAFGSSFSMAATDAALISTGVVFAGAGLFVGQILVAWGRTAGLAVAWLMGVVAALATILVAPLDGAVANVAVGFVVGEALALFTLVVIVTLVSAGAGQRLLGVSTVARRAFDIAVASCLLLLTAPIVVLVGLAVRLESPGPVLYRQERIGKDGKPFMLVKIRTMRADGDDEVFTEHLAQLEMGRGDGLSVSLRIEQDARITRVGQHLRRWSIDELPNFWNVLAGSMSLVGPRPLVPEEARLIGLNHRRFTVQPGVTGLAQVMGRDALTMSERTAFDEQYVENRSPRLDLTILLRTLWLIVSPPAEPFNLLQSGDRKSV